MSSALKIGYVIPYLDNSDPEWISLYSRYSNANLQKDDFLECKARFKTNPFFKYQLRGIEKFMPWVNNIYLIVQSPSQIPAFINQDEVKIIYHEDFIPSEFLPTFNSNTIESFLPKLNLKELGFIYANDDTYIFNETSIDDFFDEITMPKNSLVFHRPCKNIDDFHRLNFHISKFIADKLKIQYFNKTYWLPYHVQKAMNMVILRSIYAEFEEDILKSITRFRSPTNFSQALYTVYYMLSTNCKYLNNNISYRRTTLTNMKEVKKIFSMTSYPKLVCLNNSCLTPEDTIEVLNFFQQTFPRKSKYEI